MALKAYIENHKTWSLMWAGFAVFWLIGFGYYCAKLDNVLYDGHPYYMDLRPTKFIEGGRKFPAFLLCAGTSNVEGQNSSITADCTRCIPDREGGDPTNVCPNQEENKIPSRVPFKLGAGCMAFNYDGWREETGGYITCELNYTATNKARAYIYDQSWDIFEADSARPVFPNGAVQRTLPTGTRSLLEITRELYEFSDKPGETSFTLLDGETYPASPEFSQSSLMIYYGTSQDRVFIESSKKITTGFDFWYWIGFLGGLSFFCYSLHSIIYAFLCIALGWKEDEDDFATLA